MGCQKTTKQVAQTNCKPVDGIKVGNAAGTLFGDGRFIDKIGRTQIKPSPGKTSQYLNSYQEVYLVRNEPEGRENGYNDTAYPHRPPIPEHIRVPPPITHRQDRSKGYGCNDDGIGKVGKTQVPEHKYRKKWRGKKHRKVKRTLEDHVFPKISDIEPSQKCPKGEIMLALYLQRWFIHPA